MQQQVNLRPLQHPQHRRWQPEAPLLRHRQRKQHLHLQHTQPLGAQQPPSAAAEADCNSQRAEPRFSIRRLEVAFNSLLHCQHTHQPEAHQQPPAEWQSSQAAHSKRGAESRLSTQCSPPHQPAAAEAGHGGNHLFRQAESHPSSSRPEAVLNKHLHLHHPHQPAARLQPAESPAAQVGHSLQWA
jgi:hypothetical protein